MAVKKVYTIKDKILNDEFELSGQSGCLSSDDNSLMLLDFAQMGQYILENCCNDEAVSEKRMSNMSRQWAEEICKQIMDNVFENALSDAEDDEEIEVIL